MTVSKQEAHIQGAPLAFSRLPMRTNMAPFPISPEQREHLRFLDASSTQMLKSLSIFPSFGRTFLTFKDVAT